MTMDGDLQYAINAEYVLRARKRRPNKFWLIIFSKYWIIVEKAALSYGLL